MWNLEGIKRKLEQSYFLRRKMISNQRLWVKRHRDQIEEEVKYERYDLTKRNNTYIQKYLRMRGENEKNLFLYNLTYFKLQADLLDPLPLIFLVFSLDEINLVLWLDPITEYIWYDSFLVSENFIEFTRGLMYLLY